MWEDFILPLKDFSREIPVLVLVPGIGMAFHSALPRLPTLLYPQSTGWTVSELSNSILPMHSKLASEGPWNSKSAFLAPTRASFEQMANRIISKISQESRIRIWRRMDEMVTDTVTISEPDARGVEKERILGKYQRPNLSVSELEA